ncbi:hypothetical protein PPL_07653 [Heterostelium album PN500]|uniref:SCP domain-containing protein n=1 Tax=Heterostelium pallidum (strain ATCC 26659 / Pp 5 / PN500) TaxID=670386 RepID=D3BGK1_HETP5|nr:hypothetical protein PPL_07653 [Heterostelium album PN500]EFA79235.1 hypothetical protein PPL_07653 [Heterostelium album PN500]|eukprot:XP_020431356.1 hypothetical protein PPL_07653 [Heterostelium album PN500]
MIQDMTKARENSLFRMINDYRVGANLPPFIYDFNVYQVAMEQVYNIIITRSSRGFDKDSRLTRVRGVPAAGNTAHVTAKDSALSAYKMWITSPNSTRNILNPTFKFSAIAGDLDLDGSWYFVQIYFYKYI